MRLKNDAQRDQKEREALLGKIEYLQAQLRTALDENRNLNGILEERKRALAQDNAREEAAARETALDNARELFRTMLSEAEGRGNKKDGRCSALWEKNDKSSLRAGQRLYE